MKRVWIDNNCLSKDDPLTKEVANLLGKDEFCVELFGVSFYDYELPKTGFFQIVDYGSRDMLYDGMNQTKEEN